VVEDELLAFPTGEHDDVVDVCSYAAIKVSRGSQPKARQL